MTVSIIARTSHTNEDKFDALPWRNDMVLDRAVLERGLGAFEVVRLRENLEHTANLYNVDLFTPRGDAYSVQLVEMDENGADVWAFGGSDEAFFIFCRWYVSIGGRAKLIRPERIAA